MHLFEELRLFLLLEDFPLYGPLTTIDGTESVEHVEELSSTIDELFSCTWPFEISPLWASAVGWISDVSVSQLQGLESLSSTACWSASGPSPGSETSETSLLRSLFSLSRCPCTEEKFSKILSLDGLSCGWCFSFCIPTDFWSFPLSLPFRLFRLCLVWWKYKWCMQKIEMVRWKIKGTVTRNEENKMKDIQSWITI